MKEEEDEERRRGEHDTLEAAKAALTDVQRRTIDLYYGYGGMTEASVAELLGTSQQNVHKNLAAAIRKMKKFFDKTGC
jgi:RNA polymerase sigma factor (sigma-70 family)